MTTATRSEVLPDVPTVGDFVPGYEASHWSGIGAPKARLPRSLKGLTARSTPVSRAQIKARFADLGGAVFFGSPSDFGKLIAEDTEKWGKVIRFAGIKAE